ncbi:MAG: type II toxin-antitoxin system RelE/ParE family toxin [Herpetosiphonaceae bacterium]|nr:type II toxin-antitoxin system RelE/ParE family toxin [Herpetosiphonaceae bacterium]
MEIIETSIFTRQVKVLLSEEEYRALQLELVQHPESGAIIKGSGGIRKVRWGIGGRGKRGGVRVIYYLALGQNQLLMLLMYPKNVQDDLSEEQLKVLKNIVAEEYP